MPPTPSAPRPKTLKIGFLWLIKKKLTGWTLNNRFCILTNANELEWYKKQEDQVEHKTGGAFKKLESCEIDETEDLNGQEWCFYIKTQGKTHYFAATGDQDRMNWMVEILKLRPPAEIISMFDHPKLSKHAAFALVNLCGAKDQVVQIVKIGGVQALVGFLDKLNPQLKEEEKLISSIYFLLSKLCERDENKQEIGLHQQMLIDLFNRSNNNERYTEHVAQAIQLCCTIDENRNKFVAIGGIRWLFDALEKDVGERAKIALLEILYQLSLNDKIRTAIGDTYLESLVYSIAKVREAVKVTVIKVLTHLATTPAILEKMKKIIIVPHLVALLTSSFVPLQESSSAFIAFLLENDDAALKHKSELKQHGGVQNLIASLASNDLVKDKSLKAILSFVSSSADNSIEFAKQGEAAISIISLIAAGDPNATTPAPEVKELTPSALGIMKTLSINETSRVECTNSTKTIKALLAGLVRLKDELLEDKVLALANYSTVDRVKIEIAKSPLLAWLIERINGSDTRGLGNILITLSNCSTLAFVKQSIGKLFGLKSLVNILKTSTDDVIRQNAASILANCTVELDNAATVRETGVPALVGALSASNTILLAQAARALSNIAFVDESDIVADNNGIKPLIELVNSSDNAVKEYATAALRNCSVSDKGKSEIHAQGGIKPLLESLKCNNLRVLEHACLTVRNCISKEGTPNEVVKLGILSLLALIKEDQTDIKVLENALWVLSYCHTNVQDKIIILKSGSIPLLLNCVESRNERVKEIASVFIAQCLKRPDNQTELVPRALQKMYSLLSLPNPKVVENLLSIIYYASKNPKMKPLVAEGAKRLIPFLRSPSQKVRHYAGGALINSALNADNEVDLKSVAGIATIITLNDVQIRHNSCWKIKLSALDSDTRLEITTSKQPALTVSFQTKAQMKYRLAKCLACCFYGHEYRPDEEDFKKEEEKPSEPISGDPTPPPASPLLNSDESVPSPRNKPAPPLGALTKASSTTGKSAPLVASPTNTPPTPSRASSKKFGSSAQVATPQAAKRSGNQFLGLNRKEQNPTTSSSSSSLKQAPKLKSNREQLEAITHYRSFSNPVIAQYLDSILSYMRESFLKISEEKEVKGSLETQLILGAGIVQEEKGVLRYVNGDMGVPAVARAEKSNSPTVSWPYFEVYVISAGLKGTIGIGFVAADYPLDQQPGWQQGSFGYHGDDGNKFFDGNYDAYGPKFTTGDIIGCGFNNITKEIFYTKNGLLIGTAFENAFEDFYPAVGLAGPGEKVFINFGQFPFVFDFNFKTTGGFTAAPKAEPGIEPTIEPPPKVLSGELGEVFEGLSADWFFLQNNLFEETRSRHGSDAFYLNSPASTSSSGLSALVSSPLATSTTVTE